MCFFDSHAHYDDVKFDIDREEIINKIFEDGITRVVSAGYSIKGSIAAKKKKKKYSFIYATCRSFTK